MRISTLLKRNFTHYARTNLAVVFGVATAVAVLAGALLVGDSVRASLRDLLLQRLGRAEHILTAKNFFREQLAGEMQSDVEFAASGFDAACPLVVLQGTLTHEESGRRGAGVAVYGVDERFWKFHGRENAAAEAPRGFEALLSASLGGELRAQAGDALLLRVEKPSAIPLESLHGRKEEAGSTLRLKTRGRLDAASLGEFSIQPQQAAVRAVFVPLRLLQRELEQDERVNAVLVSLRDGVDEREGKAQATSADFRRLLRKHFTLEDLGIRLRRLEDRRDIALESDSALVGDALAAAASATASASHMRAAPVLSYLANSIRSGAREIPYSLVTAVDAESFERLKEKGTGARATTENIARTKTETGERAETQTGGRARTETSAPTDSVEATDSGEAEAARASVESDGDATASSLAPIILNEWAARELSAGVGARVTLEYFLWQEDGRLLTRAAEFRLAGVVPIEGEAADRNLVPEYPGITEASSLAGWNPPFPVELSRIGKRDEDYWHEYRTTPKAFVTLERGQELWGTRYGRLTSMRLRTTDDAPLEASLESYRAKLRDALDPAQMGMTIYPLRERGLEASRGATDFGEYFLYFSFFLVVSALLLTALFFRLGVEQRLREIGILRAVGFTPASIRRLFLGEAVALALFGSLLGLAGAYVYGRLMMAGLRTWWVGAVGTTALGLHVSPASLLYGMTGAVLAALAAIVWTLRGLARSSPRSLLAGSALHARASESRTDIEGKASLAGRVASWLTPLRGAAVSGAAGLLVLLATSTGRVSQSAGFFGGGILLLVALLCMQAAALRRRERSLIRGRGWLPLFRLGMRNATHRPGRSVLCITLIACAAFVVVAVDAFRRDDRDAALDRKSGGGGYPLLAESLLPLVHNPDTPEGREALSLASDAQENDKPDQQNGKLDAVSFARFRVRPGDDASCLNLYQPRNPKILAPTDDFIRAARFSFQDSLAATDAERENPWLLLNRNFPDGAIPVVADANSMSYVLHLKLGEDFLLERGDASPALRLRFVGALSDSIFQSELLMSEQNFRRLFPEREGFRFFLIDVPSTQQAAAIAGTLEERLSDFGFDVVPTGERLASFHRVENTYLSTFQMLGGLGLVLGTLGLSAVLLRNVLERRRELALLRAFGYGRRHFALMSLAENALLLFCGLATGTTCALLSIAPVFFSRGGQFPVFSIGGLLLAVVAAGLASSLLATIAALRSPLLPALRAE